MSVDLLQSNTRSNCASLRCRELQEGLHCRLQQVEVYACGNCRSVVSRLCQCELTQIADHGAAEVALDGGNMILLVHRPDARERVRLAALAMTYVVAIGLETRSLRRLVAPGDLECEPPLNP